VNLTDWTPTGYARSLAALQAAQATGATSVSLIPTLYVDDATDSSVARDPQRTPTDDSLIVAARQARQLGMSVTIKPHVDALDGTFRGDLAPVDPAAWFASYRREVARYARLAQAVGATTFIVATELRSLSRDDEQFRLLIHTARSGFGGQLTYAANWDEVDRVGFWDALDIIGVDAYVPLQITGAPSASALQTAWAPFKDKLAQLYATTGKAVMFTELGYESRSGTLASPFAASGAADASLQALAYQAAFSTWAGVPWFRGITWWDWRADGRTDDRGFSPRGKPAEAILRAWTQRDGTPAAAAEDRGWKSIVAVVVSALASATIVAAAWRRRRGTPAEGDGAERPALQEEHDRAAQDLLDWARRILDASVAVVCVRDFREPRSAQLVLGSGLPDGLIGSRVCSDEGLVGHVLITGNPIAVANCDQLPAAIRPPFAQPVGAALSVPLRLHGVLIGALTFGRDDQFAPSERHLLAPLANRLAQLVQPADGPATRVADRQPALGLDESPHVQG
jgi:GAF domain-containing protein